MSDKSPQITGYEYGFRCGECENYYEIGSPLSDLDFDGPVTNNATIACPTNGCGESYTVRFTKNL